MSDPTYPNNKVIESPEAALQRQKAAERQRKSRAARKDDSRIIKCHVDRFVIEALTALADHFQKSRSDVVKLLLLANPDEIPDLRYSFHCRQIQQLEMQIRLPWKHTNRLTSSGLSAGDAIENLLVDCVDCQIDHVVIPATPDFPARTEEQKSYWIMIADEDPIRLTAYGYDVETEEDCYGSTVPMSKRAARRLRSENWLKDHPEHRRRANVINADSIDIDQLIEAKNDRAIGRMNNRAVERRNSRRNEPADGFDDADTTPVPFREREKS